LNVRGKKVLVFVAHQDDETIGCGGTIHKWSNEGAEIYVCFMTDGATGYEQGSGLKNDITSVRMREATYACHLLGAKEVSTLGLPCQQIRNDKQTFHKVIQKIRQIRPNVVITHSAICKHRDHRITSSIVEESCWKSTENILEDLGLPHTVDLVLQCEILDTFQNPDFIVDITKEYITKCEAMAVYTSQRGVIPGIEQYLNGISLVRGYSSGPNRRAEAFKRLGNLPYKL
jgi:LmbE family N-acetylglucosaminyl deacetylase